MSRPDRQLPKCANCEIEIWWQPLLVDGRTYCCAGCAGGGLCSCDYSNLPGVDSRKQVKMVDRARSPGKA